MYIVKRSGETVEFDKNKIINAINKAFVEVDGTLYEDETAQEIANDIEKEINKSPANVTVEMIQDWVEDELMQSERRDVARAYIRFRYKKEVARDVKADFFDAIGEKLSASNIQNQNANVDEASFGGRIGEASSVMTKQYALDYIVSNMAKQNHLNNEIYIHDLDSYAVGMHNCCARETKFITKDFGVHSFSDHEDGDKIVVLSHDGSFNNATVKKFGVQKLNKVTFSLAGQRFVTERFTANHRWILENGAETTHLKIGDKLYKAPISISPIFK
jgi:transcriptional regulator NrdR family protein